ncbi:MAG: hypothetical protein AAF726_11100 [Planctomycetota bacterium]
MAANSAPAQLTDFLVICPADVIQIEKIPNAGSAGGGNAIRVKLQELEDLALALENQVKKYSATGPLDAVHQFIKEAKSNYGSYWKMTELSGDGAPVPGGKKDFNSICKRSIPSDGIWLLPGQHEYLHVVLDGTEKPDSKGKYTNRRIAYAKDGSLIKVIWAPLIPTEWSKIPR